MNLAGIAAFQAVRGPGVWVFIPRERTKGVPKLDGKPCLHLRRSVTLEELVTRLRTRS